MFDDTPLIRVNDDESLAKAIEQLAQAPVIGIDTESDSFYSYQEKVCLIQISDNHADYIIDPLAVSDLSSLGPILANPDVVKILHGADYDVVCLKRDYGFEFRNLFDTLIAAQLLGLDRIGLADLIGRYFGWEIDKKYQRHDWSRRPLKAEHIEYARGDTHWLLALREILMRKLERVDRVRHMVEECSLVEEREWQGRSFDPDAYLHAKGIKSLDQQGLRIMRELWTYRDEEAKRLDRPVFKVMPDSVLLQVAKGKPKSKGDLDKLWNGKSALKRRYGSGLLDAVAAGLDNDETIEMPKPKKKPKRKGPKPRLRGKQAERAMSALKSWRNKLVNAEADQSSFTVASNGTLQTIASVRPRTLEELSEIPDVRQWQVDDHGEAILAILDKADPPKKKAKKKKARSEEAEEE